jgi:hypothetical protein
MKKNQKSSGYGLVKERIEIARDIVALAGEIIDFSYKLAKFALVIYVLIDMACNYLKRTMWFDVRTKMANQI